MTGVSLTLERLEPSCPCTTASIVGDAAKDSPTILGSGQTFAVQVAVDPNQLSPGLFHKSVWVFVQGQESPAATLEVTGALLPVVTVLPPSLDFGHLEKGTELTLLLKASLLPDQLEMGSELRLVSPDQDIEVTEVPPTGQSPSRSYRVRLAPHAHVGRLQGKLTLVLAHVGEISKPAAPVVATVAWQADVAGMVSASPAVVAFGMIPSGQRAERRVLLKGKDLQRLTISSNSPFLSALLEPIPEAQQQRVITIQLKTTAPTGPLDAHLLVSTQSGEQLILPVFGIVQP